MIEQIVWMEIALIVLNVAQIVMIVWSVRHA
jgi:hypothetical protein